MKNKVLLNIFLNTVLAVVFVLLNIWALKNGLEETFVTIALFYSVTTVVSNAFFVTKAR